MSASFTSEGFSAAATAQNRLVGYAYDASGNMQTGGYSYDAENRLTGAGGVSYTYDGEGQRVRKSSGRLYWYGAGGQVLTETDATGALIHEFVYLGGRRVGFINSAGNRYYYWSDHLGSANVVTNAQGAIKEESDFYPFGGERVITDLLDNRYKFTGKERDESGLDYFGARYYSSNMGRFLTADWSATPVAIPYADLGNPQSLNLYSYVENNPITGVDPEGHFRFPSGHDQDPQYEGPDSANTTEQEQEAQKERAAEKATTMPFPLTPELPRVGLGKLVTTALGAAADLVTAPVVMVVATVGYLVSPGTGGMTEEKDTIQGHEAVAGGAGAKNGGGKSSEQIRKEWETATGKPWPKDAATGRNQDVSHERARADGGTDHLSNIRPRPRQEHVDLHRQRGDFKRWGQRARKEPEDN